MTRRRLLLSVAAVLAAGPLWAGSYEDEVISQLHRQGFRDISRSRTLLGRSRIVATGRGLRREIVLNPNTGEILRDYTERTGDGSAEADVMDSEPEDGGSSPEAGDGNTGGDTSSGDGSSGDGGQDGGSEGEGGSDGGSDGED